MSKRDKKLMKMRAKVDGSGSVKGTGKVGGTKESCRMKKGSISADPVTGIMKAIRATCEKISVDDQGEIFGSIHKLAEDSTQ